MLKSALGSETADTAPAHLILPLPTRYCPTVIFFSTKVTKSHILYTVTLLSTRGFIPSITQHHSPSFRDLRNFNFKKIPLPLGAASGCMASFYRQNLSDLLCFSCTFPICQSVQ